jgi:hypothetical protein
MLLDDYPRMPETDEDVRIRRSTHRMCDLLAPTHDQAALVFYCFALATTANDQIPCALMTTPNLLDVMITDPVGERCDYTQLCHGLIARGRNKQIDRYDTFWTRSAPDHCVMLDADETIRNLVELLALPVALCLVEDLRHWNGAQLLPDQWGEVQPAPRPKILSTARTRLPKLIEFTPMPPEILIQKYGLEGAKQVVNDALDEHIEHLNRTRTTRSGSSRVLGRRGCDELEPLGRRGDPKPPPRMPHFAGTVEQVRASEEELHRKRVFYAECREVFRTHQDVVFPAGTVMFRKLGANCDPLPPSRLNRPFDHFDTLPPPATKP